MQKIQPYTLNQLYKHVGRVNNSSNVRLLTNIALPNNQPELRNQILSETKSTSEHLTPEIRLNLITSECRLWNTLPEDAPFHEPYWGFYWPGGQALTRYVLDAGSSLVSGKRVLDFGCGCGASGLAAAANKAKRVIFNDIDQMALEAVMINGTSNKITVKNISSENLLSQPCDDVDVVLVGDMLYDTEFADQVLQWLLNIHHRGGLILIGDPGRFAWEEHPLKSHLRCLAKYQLLPHTLLENKGFSQAFVWTFL